MVSSVLFYNEPERDKKLYLNKIRSLLILQCRLKVLSRLISEVLTDLLGHDKKLTPDKRTTFNSY